MRPSNNITKIKIEFEKLIDNALKTPNSYLYKIKSALDSYSLGAKPYSIKEQIIDHIRTNFKTHLLLSPSEQDYLIKRWPDNNFHILNTGAKNRKYWKKTDLCNEILELLKYDDFRSEYGVHYYNIVQFKSCPYCNCAPTLISINKSQKQKARFQLDHYYPKAKHPFLSICFFNLIPSCSNCNQGKSSSEVSLKNDFHPYHSGSPKEAFRFHLPKDSLSKYLISGKRDDIKVHFKDGRDAPRGYAKNHDNSYGITSLYETQKDVVEELIWKQKAYPKSKINELKKILKVDAHSVKRMVVGNYYLKDDVHKRPLSKFTSDIAKELKLI